MAILKPMINRDTLRKIVLKRVSPIVALAILSGALSACAGESEPSLDPVLEANCDQLLSNLKNLQQRPEFLPHSDQIDTSIPLLLGSNSRAKAEQEILSLFPDLDQVISGKEKDEQKTDFDALYSASVFMVREAIAGTSVDFPFSTAEAIDIARDPASWEDQVSPFAMSVFGDIYGDEPGLGCGVIDEIKYGYDSDNNTAVAFERATNDFIDLAQALQVIRNCQESGWHQGTECAEDDHVSEPDTYTPSDELTEEEKIILEERERQANQDSDDQPSTTDSTEPRPLQVCLTFGVVVTTEKYGELTCKAVLVNRIRTLMWMK